MSYMNNNTNFDTINSEDEIDVVFKAFDVSDTTNIHLGEDGFKTENLPMSSTFARSPMRAFSTSATIPNSYRTSRSSTTTL